MMRSLEGRHALITGSTGGLGFAMAEGLARAGCGIVLNGLVAEEDVLPQCRRLAEETNVSVRYCRADVGNPEEIARLVKFASDGSGPVDILVNNAVVRHFASIDTFPTEQWNEAMDVNISAAFHSIRLLLPGMRQRNFGRIFNMASVYGSRGTANRIAYVTSKSALIGMTRAVAMETLAYDITCHAICPGTVLTPGTDERIAKIVESGVSRDDAERTFLEGKQPTGRFIRPESVISLMLVMCGPAGRDMTGGMVTVEGGWLSS